VGCIGCTTLRDIEQSEEKDDPTNKMKKQDPSTEQKEDFDPEQRKDDQKETSIELKWAMQIAEGKWPSVGEDQYQVHTVCCILCLYLF